MPMTVIGVPVTIVGRVMVIRRRNPILPEGWITGTSADSILDFGIG
jgi:hypothetical protein